MKLIRSSQATLVHVQIKIVELADCLLLIGQVGERENVGLKNVKMATFLIRCNLKITIFIHKKSQIVKVVCPLWCTCYRIILRKITHYY